MRAAYVNLLSILPLVAGACLMLAAGACGGNEPLDTNGGPNGHGATGGTTDSVPTDSGVGGAGDRPRACAPLARSLASPNTTPPPAGCSCTRRPGLGNSQFCPAGINESASAVIGPEGGELLLTGRQGTGVQFRLMVPPGALQAPTYIKVTETDLAPPSDFIDYSPVYLVEPLGTQLAGLATLRVPWSSSTTTMPPPGFALYASGEATSCAFQPLGDSYTNAGFQTGSVTSLGYFMVGAIKGVEQAACP